MDNPITVPSPWTTPLRLHKYKLFRMGSFPKTAYFQEKTIDSEHLLQHYASKVNQTKIIIHRLKLKSITPFQDTFLIIVNNKPFKNKSNCELKKTSSLTAH